MSLMWLLLIGCCVFGVVAVFCETFLKPKYPKKLRMEGQVNLKWLEEKDACLKDKEWWIKKESSLVERMVDR